MANIWALNSTQFILLLLLLLLSWTVVVVLWNVFVCYNEVFIFSRSFIILLWWIHLTIESMWPASTPPKLSPSNTNTQYCTVCTYPYNNTHSKRRRRRCLVLVFFFRIQTYLYELYNKRLEFHLHDTQTYSANHLMY